MFATRSSRAAWRTLALAAVCAGLAARPATVWAQTRAPRPTITGTASVNLLGIPFGWLAAEGERATRAPGVAVGAGVLTTLGYAIDDGGYRFTSAQVKLKYYPSENGLRGFSVGLTAGVASARDRVYEYYTFVTPGVYTSTTNSSTRTKTAPTLGAVLDYNFLIGRRQRFLIGLGVGARRVFVSERNRGPLDRTLPDGRLQVGLGF